MRSVGADLHIGAARVQRVCRAVRPLTLLVPGECRRPMNDRRGVTGHNTRETPASPFLGRTAADYSNRRIGEVSGFEISDSSSSFEGLA